MGTTHTVASGESLWSIGQKYGGISPAVLLATNDLESSTIHAGQELKIPDCFVAEKGDSAESVAQRNRTDYSRLIEGQKVAEGNLVCFESKVGPEVPTETTMTLSNCFTFLQASFAATVGVTPEIPDYFRNNDGRISYSACQSIGRWAFASAFINQRIIKDMREEKIYKW